jgi:hypothetical protein
VQTLNPNNFWENFRYLQYDGVWFRNFLTVKFQTQEIVELANSHLAICVVKQIKYKRHVVFTLKRLWNIFACALLFVVLIDLRLKKAHSFCGCPTSNFQPYKHSSFIHEAQKRKRIQKYDTILYGRINF